MSRMSDAKTPINVAVIGTGRMGTHHTRTAANAPFANLLAVVDVDQDRAKALADQYGCETCKDVDELLARFPQVQAVTVSLSCSIGVALWGRDGESVAMAPTSDTRIAHRIVILKAGIYHEREQAKR